MGGLLLLILILLILIAPEIILLLFTFIGILLYGLGEFILRLFGKSFEDKNKTQR